MPSSIKGEEINPRLLCSEWAQNEEMVDWIARQFPKLLDAFKAVEAMD